MTISNFDRAATNQFTADMNAAIAEVARKHGVAVPTLDIRRSRDGSFVRIMKVDVYAANRNPMAMAEAVVQSISPGATPNALGMKALFGSLTLPEAMEHFGVRSTTNAKGDKLTGYNSRAPKYPFVYTSGRGTAWRITVEQARKRFGAVIAKQA